MCRFCCITFIEYVLAGKTLLDYTNFFFPNDFKNNNKIIDKYFKDKYGRRSKSWVYVQKNWWNKMKYNISWVKSIKGYVSI